MKKNADILDDLSKEHQQTLQDQELDEISLDDSNSLKNIINPKIHKMNEASDYAGLFSEDPVSFIE